MGVQALPVAASLPLPRDVVPGAGWCAHMLEMADHIGAYETLLLSEAHGGAEIYIPIDPKKNPLLPLLGARKARILSGVYGRTTIIVPTARYALNQARRAPVLASVRSGQMSVADAARLLGTRRDYVSKLVNRTREGCDAAPLPRPGARDPRQLDMFGQP